MDDPRRDESTADEVVGDAKDLLAPDDHSAVGQDQAADHDPDPGEG